MSKTIDERVVSMQFDNKHFESNVKTTMSTLDKLKQSLNLSGASKGLENVNAAARKCDLSPVSNAVETVKARFSAMEIVGVTALVNLANSAVNYGKQIVNSLTIQPVTTGFNEYELKMGSIQTIMASTGASLETVNKYLNELNEYSDQTIYSFQDMTNNIGKFTNAGIDLEDAVVAIKGIANEAALSGANANEAARAMYNFSQALSTGYVQRIDWKSIELANMATQGFKEELLKTAIEMDTVKKNAEGMYQAVGDDKWYNTSQIFIEALDEQWLTSKVLIETLKKYASEEEDIGIKAKAAATEVKTFSMLMDTLKESAQSGWAQSWEIITGDFNEAKSLFTTLSNKIGDIISATSDKRNAFLSRLFEQPSIYESDWTSFAQKAKVLGVNVDKFKEALIDTADPFEEFKEVMLASGMTVEELEKKLEEAGGDHKVLLKEWAKDDGTFLKSLKKGWAKSNVVVDVLKKFTGESEKTKESFEDITKYTVVAGDNLTKIAKKYGTTWQKIYEANKDVIGDNPNLIYPDQVFDITVALDKLSDAELRNIGYTEEQIKTLRGLQEQAEETGVPIEELIKQLEKPSGRELLFDSFAKIFERLKKVFDVFKKTWEKVFAEFPNADEVLYGLLEKFAAFVDNGDLTAEKINAIASAFEALCRSIQLAAILSGGVWGIIVRILKAVGDELDVDFWNIIETVSELIIAFYNWILVDNALYDSLIALGTTIASFLSTTIGGILDFVKSFKELTTVKMFLNQLKEAFVDIGDWLSGFGGIFRNFFEVIRQLSALDELTLDSFLGALKGLGRDIFAHFGGLGEIIGRVVHNVYKLTEAFFDQLGLGGVFRTVVGWIDKARIAWDNWVNGVKTSSDELPVAIGKAIANGIIELIKFLASSIGSLAGQIWAGLTGSSKEAEAGMEEAGGNIVSGLAKGILNGIKFVAQVIISLATTLITAFCETIDSHSPSLVFMAIGGFIIAGLVNGLLNSKIDLTKAMGTIGGWLTKAFGSETGEKIKNAIGNVLNFLKTGFGGVITFLSENFGAIAAIIGGWLMISAVTKFVNVITPLVTVVKTITKCIGGMFESFGKAAVIVAKAGAVVLFAIAVTILADALGKFALLTWPDIGKGAAVIAGFAVIFLAVAAVMAKIAKSIKFFDAPALLAVAAVIGSFAVSILILSYALSLMNDLHIGHMFASIAVLIVAMVALAGIAVAMSALAPKISWGSLAMIAIAGALLILVVALTRLNALNIDDPKKVITFLIAMVAGLAIVSKMSSGIKAGAAIGMIGMVIGIRLFIGTLEKIAKMDYAVLNKGVRAMSKIMMLFAGLMLTTKLAGKNASKAGVAVLGITVSILLITAAIKALAKMDSTTLAKGISAITKLILVFGLIVVMSKFAGSEAMKAGVMLMGVGVAMLLIAAAMSIIVNNVPADRLAEVTASLAVLIGMLAVVVAASHFAKDAKVSLIAIAVAVGLLVIALGALAMMDEKLAPAVAALSTVMLVLALLVASLKFIKMETGKQLAGTIVSLVLIGVIVGLLGWTIKSLAEIPNPNAALSAAGAISMVLLSIAAAVAILGKVKGVGTDAIIAAAAMFTVVWGLGQILLGLATLDPKQAIGTATALSILVIALSAACLVLSKSTSVTWKAILAAGAMGIVMVEIAAILALCQVMKVDAAFNNVASLSALLTVISAACWILSKSSNVTWKAILAAGAMGIVLAEIAGVLALCRLMGADATIDNVASLGTLLMAISAACWILSKSKGITLNAVLAAGAMGIVLAEIAGVLALCRLMGVDATAGTVASLGALLMTIAGACWILAQCKSVSGSAILAAMAMGIVLAEIAGVLALCHLMGVDAAFNNVAALSALLLVISASCLILSKCGKVSGSAIIAAMAMGIVLAEIAAVLALCQVMKVDAAMNNVLGLSVLLLALSVSCAILSGIMKVNFGAILAVAVLGLVLLELGWVLSVIQKMNVAPCLDVVITLSALLLAMSVITMLLSIVGAGALAAIPAAVAVMAVVAIIGVIATALGALMSLIPQDLLAKWKVGLTEFMDFLVIFCGGIGEAIGAFAGGALAGFGSGLSDFMTNIQGFIDGAKQIDATVADGMKALGVAILAITGAGILDGLASLFGLGDIGDLGDSLASFGKGMRSFADSVADLTDEDIEHIRKSADAGAAIAEMAKLIPRQGGWWQEIAGSVDMADFGARMEAFGKSLVLYGHSIRDLTEADIEHIKLSAGAGTAIADMESSIPKQGGLWQEFAGAQDMADFGTRMEAFGESLVIYAESIRGLTEGDITNIKTSASAGEAMSGMESSIPKQDGWWQDVVGEKDMKTFGKRMEAFGKSLVEYVATIKAMPTNASALISRSKQAVANLVAVADIIPKDDGWWGIIAGEKDVKKFGKGMQELAGGLAEYSKAAAALGPNAATNITNSQTAVQALVNVASIVGTASCNVDTSFGSDMIALAKHVVEYAWVAAGIQQPQLNCINNATTAISAMATAAEALPNSGGLAGLFAGENNDFEAFGIGMCSLVRRVREYISYAREITADDLTSANLSAAVIAAMAKAASVLPNSGGFAALLAGDNTDFEAFGTGMCSLIQNVLKYRSYASEITEDDVASIKYSGDAISAMAEAAKKLPNSGGVIGWFAGDNNNYASFGNGMAELAKAIVSYAGQAYCLTPDMVEGIENSKDAISKLVGAGKAAQKLNDIDLTNAAPAVQSLEQIAKVAKGMVGIDFTGMGAFTASLESLGSAGVNQFITAFTGAYDRASAAGKEFFEHLVDGMWLGKVELNVTVSKLVGSLGQTILLHTSKFEEWGESLINYFANGITRASKTVSDAVTGIIDSARSAISNKDEYWNWYNAGSYLVDGFAAGINGNTWAATAKARAMANAALQAAKTVLAINSPSKVFRDVVGRSVPEGFAAGVDKFGYMVIDSTEAMADNAINGTQKAIANLANMVDSDIDTQPTIRPVLDLSDVTSGANAINSMFGMTPSIGVLSRVGGISSDMNQRQNGGNDDVVSELKRLNKNLEDGTGDTYTFGDISFGDDDATGRALGELARGIKIAQRR